MDLQPAKFYFSELFLLVFGVALITLDASQSYTHYVNYLSLAFIGVTAVEMSVKGHLRMDRFRFIFPMFGFLIFSWMMLIFNFEGLQRQITYSLVFLLFASVFLVIRTTARTWPIELALAIGVLIIWKTQGASFAEVKSFKGQRLEFTVGSDEGGLNANLYGLYLVLCVFFCIKFLLIDSVIKKKRTIWWWGRCALMVIAALLSVQQIIFVTGSRKAQLMLFASFAVAYLIYTIGGKDRKTFKIAVGSMAMVLTNIFVWFELKESDHFNRIENMFDMVRYGESSETSATSRVELAQQALSLWIRSPLWGQGPEGFATKSGHGVYCHSGYLEILCNFGLIGVTVYYFVFYRVFRISWKWRKSSFESLRKYSFWLLGVFGSICLLFEPFAVTYYMKIMAVYLGCIFGVVAFIERR